MKRSSHELTLQVEIMDILITAMEKFHWDHTSISDYLKRELDMRYGCSWHVVTGEEFGFDIDFEVTHWLDSFKFSTFIS